MECELCGRKLHARNNTGVCKSNDVCLKEWRRRRSAVKDYDTCECGKPKSKISPRCRDCYDESRPAQPWCTKDGYVIVPVPEGHPMGAGKKYRGYMREHRLVMERHLGRYLSPGETVHHINGDRMDNRIENLELRQGNHGPGVRFICLDCGSNNVTTTHLEVA